MKAVNILKRSLRLKPTHKSRVDGQQYDYFFLLISAQHFLHNFRGKRVLFSKNKLFRLVFFQFRNIFFKLLTMTAMFFETLYAMVSCPALTLHGSSQ